MPATVRFLNNFILTTIETYTDDQGLLRVRQNTNHVAKFDVVNVASIVAHDGFVDIEFLPSGTIKGVAQNVEKDYCEILNDGKPKTASTTTKSGGCGTCGKKKK